MYVISEEAEVKRPLGRSKHRWVNNIKMNFGEIEYDGMDWIGLAQHGGKGSCERGNEPSDSKKCWEVFEWIHKS
jgi:hypothetical protein